jgi:hypothetical protein
MYVLVLGGIFGTVAIAFAPSLSSNTVHLIVGMLIVPGTMRSFTSVIRPISHRTSLVASDSAEYSLSVVDSCGINWDTGTVSNSGRSDDIIDIGQIFPVGSFKTVFRLFVK